VGDWETSLPHRLTIGGETPIESQLAALPARWCVALLMGENDLPVQMLALKNLRVTLRKRFAAPIEGTSQRRIDYAQLVKSIAWRRVDSALEMDVVYQQLARQAFPQRWQKLVPQRSAWFVTIDPGEKFADFTRSESPSGKIVVGPFTSATKADTWIEKMRDAFDLCRYPNVLRQSPHGKACVYKEMGKCGAPCDGTMPLESYRKNVDDAIDAARDSSGLAERLTAQMKSHAAELKFEEAARTKTRLAVLGSIKIAQLGDFQYLAVMPGPRKSTAKLFSIGPDWLQEVAGVIDDASEPPMLIAPSLRLDPNRAADHIAMVCHHLTARKADGKFLPIGFTTSAYRKALREVMAIEEEAETTGDEVMRESALEGV
jgi:hypothetical protein